jgi:hypothetical protein
LRLHDRLLSCRIPGSAIDSDTAALPEILAVAPRRACARRLLLIGRANRVAGFSRTPFAQDRCATSGTVPDVMRCGSDRGGARGSDSTGTATRAGARSPNPPGRAMIPPCAPGYRAAHPMEDIR